MNYTAEESARDARILHIYHLLMAREEEQACPGLRHAIDYCLGLMDPSEVGEAKEGLREHAQRMNEYELMLKEATQRWLNSK